MSSLPSQRVFILHAILSGFCSWLIILIRKQPWKIMRYKQKFNVNLKIVKSMLFDSFEQRRVLKDSFEQHRFYHF